MNLPTTPGTCFKFTVGSADEAARLIREQLGDTARVLSVRTLASGGLFSFFAAPKLEVIAQIVTPEPVAAAEKPAPEPDGAETLGSELTPSRGRGASARLPGGRTEFRKPPSLSDLLRRSGFSEKLLLRLFESPAWLRLHELPLHRALVETGRHLCLEATPSHERAPLTRAAFIGTAGVGRTTALCKWLSTEVFRRARIGHVVTAEFDRPNSAGALPVFCEALGVPLAHFPAATEAAAPGGFVYFDLPALSLRHPADNAPIAEFLERERIEQRVLVLNAAYDHAALRAAYAAGRELGATHVVFTHLDEVTQWGRLWDYLLDGELSPLFLATGPSLTGDLAEDALDAVARRTLPMPEVDDATDRREEHGETADDRCIHTAA
jgi:flagellar biosynthesis protein FlhF